MSRYEVTARTPTRSRKRFSFEIYDTMNSQRMHLTPPQFRDLLDRGEAAWDELENYYTQKRKNSG